MTRQGKVVSITQAPQETTTESIWWSFRPAFRNEADAKMCVSMNVAYEAVIHEAADKRQVW